MKKTIVIIVLLCSLAISVGCENKNKKKEPQKETNTINPLTEVNTKEELEKLVGFEVPVIEEKEIISYIAIGQENQKEHARVLYQDGSEFDMQKGKIKNQEEVSGIYAAEEKETTKVNKTKVNIYEYEETTFGIWTDKQYSYCYAMQNTTSEDLVKELEKLIKES